MLTLFISATVIPVEFLLTSVCLCLLLRLIFTLSIFPPKNKWKRRWHATILGYIFNQHLSFLLEDACSVSEAQRIDFSVLGASVMYRSRPATLSYPQLLSQGAEVSSKKKKKEKRKKKKRKEKSLGEVWASRAAACTLSERGTNSSAGSIKVKTLFGECLSYWLCISLVTWALCCIGVARSFFQHVERQRGDAMGQILEKQGRVMF